MTQELVPAQPCPCGGELGLNYSSFAERFFVWHRGFRQSIAEPDTTRLTYEEFERLGGNNGRRDMVAGFANQCHYNARESQIEVLAAGIRLGTAFKPPLGEVKEYQAPPFQRTRELDTFTDVCSCGGSYGYTYEVLEDRYILWHRNSPGEPLRSQPIERQYLNAGLTVQNCVMDHVEGCHRADARDREAAMLAQRRADAAKPENWPDIIGKEVVVTGILQAYTRDQIGSAIRAAGGLSYDRVTSSTKLVVIGVRPGKVKVAEAKRLGIPTMGDAPFMQLLRRSKQVYDERTSTKRPTAFGPRFEDRRAVITSDQELDPVVTVRAETGRTTIPGKPIGFTANGNMVWVLPDTGEFVDGDKRRVLGPIYATDADGGLVTLTPDSLDQLAQREAVLSRRTERQQPPAAKPEPKKPRQPTVQELIDRDRFQRTERR